MGQRASFGIGTFNSFWAYTTPIIGAIIADEYLGRYNTIFIAIAFSIIGHILLVVASIPAVLTSDKAIVPCMSSLPLPLNITVKVTNSIQSSSVSSFSDSELVLSRPTSRP